MPLYRITWNMAERDLCTPISCT